MTTRRPSAHLRSTPMTTAYLAPHGFEAQLDEELGRAGVAVVATHGRLRIAEGRAVHAAWAANTWWDAERIPVRSIGHAAKELRARQRNWALYAPEHRGRAELVQEKLPHVSAQPLELGEVAPDAPLGSWTLLERDLVLAATRLLEPVPEWRAGLRRGSWGTAEPRLPQAVGGLRAPPSPAATG